MNKFNNRNKINYLSLALFNFLLFSLVFYVSYLIGEYNFYENLSINIIVIYIISLILLIPFFYIFNKIFMLIFRLSGVKFPNDENKRKNSLSGIGHFLFLYLADEFLNLDDIKSAFIRIILKSSLLTVYLLCIVKYYENPFSREE